MHITSKLPLLPSFSTVKIKKKLLKHNNLLIYNGLINIERKLFSCPQSSFLGDFKDYQRYNHRLIHRICE